MGRKPNPLILEYFERGQKLNDSSNRYAHTCKACGENFPKGRIDSLTNHLMKKCPAISEQARINACLSLHGINQAAQRSQKLQAAKASLAPVGFPTVDAQTIPQDGVSQDLPRDWTALETLAEVSRQIDLSEKHDDRLPNGATSGAEPPSGQSINHANDQFSMPDAVMGEIDSADRMQVDIKGRPLLRLPSPCSHHDTDKDIEDTDASTSALRELTTEEQLRALLPNVGSAEAVNLTMAAAATARLNPSLLDPQLLGEAVTAAMMPSLDAETTVPEVSATSLPTSQPWGGITFVVDALQAAPSTNDPAPSASTPLLQRSDSLSDLITLPLGPRNARHSRARFDADRRKEVQEVRKLGACIRCRILRKTCSMGQPCDACRKVLSPRIWRSGCIRTKFSEQLDLYSAGVQIVLAQHRINNLKASMPLVNNGTAVEVTHFPDTSIRMTALVMEKPSEDKAEETSAVGETDHPRPPLPIMIDNDSQDLPAKLEAYMREALPELISREISHFMKVTLEEAARRAEEHSDELLKRAIELWGLIEILDRERQWNITYPAAGATGVTSAGGQDSIQEMRGIREDSDQEVFTTMCLQLTAAAERKAATTSKVLLTGMQRVLQDSKHKVDHGMFFSALILLNCVEKSTWAFKAWEQENLLPLWPLEKLPGTFTEQGYVIADVLRMLLGIRRILPRTLVRESDGLLVSEDQDAAMQRYFEAIALNGTWTKSVCRLSMTTADCTDRRGGAIQTRSSRLLTN
jgi:hypothetical protein